MRTLLTLTLIGLCFSLTAQETITYPYNPDGDADGLVEVCDNKSPKNIIDSYGGFDHAVINMTREEWEIVRSWDGFDENAYLESLNNFKSSFADDRAKLKIERQAKMLQSDCECWVEPDTTYTTLVPPPGLNGLPLGEEQWGFQAGAGWDVDCSSAAISFPGWTFELYGNVYTEFYINSNGMLSFGDNVIDWTPINFPNAEYNQIAGYWQDTDLRSTGEIMYKVTPEAVFVNYLEVGYYNNHDDLTNSYQIIITPNDGIIGDGNNVRVCYLDMNWAHGDVGGSGGCCGPYPGIAGADLASSDADDSFIQFGRFNLLDDTYNWPYGYDGVNWLDFKYFDLNTMLSNTNSPPIPTENLGCDTLTICLGQTLDIGVNFLGPEPDQSVTLEVTLNLTPGNTISDFIIIDGLSASIAGVFVGNSPGINTIDIVATDDGTPASVTSVSMVIEVLNVSLPELTVEGNLSICAGAETTITALGDFDSFSWNLSSQFTNGNQAIIPFGGLVVVTGNLDVGCSVSESFNIDQTPYYLPNILTSPNPPVICSDDFAYVSVQQDYSDGNAYVGYTWEADWNGLGGEVYEVVEDGQGAWLAPGMYRILVEDASGCFGQRVFPVIGVDADIPDMTIPPMCTGLDTLVFDGGYLNLEEGDLSIYLVSSNGLGWEGSFINVSVNGEVVATLTLVNSTFDVFSVPIAFGDNIEVEYISADPDNDINNLIYFFNCSNNGNETIIENPTSGIIYSSEAMCNYSHAYGDWEETIGPGTSWFEYDFIYNSMWAPTELGVYELCFTENQCLNTYCYDVTVNSECNEGYISGCTDPTASNFDPEATEDDGSCLFIGCMDDESCNFNPDATEDDGSCDYSCCPGPGCCLDGQNWDWDLMGCVITNPTDTNLDGCTDLNDLMDILAAYGTCTSTLPEFATCGDDIEHEGYSYSTVQIGEQCWFSENCRYLPEVSPSSEGIETDPYYYVYEYQGTDVAAAKLTSKYETYGVLYNWPAVMTEGICPSDWHIPSDGEFMEFADFLGGEVFFLEGGKMKEAGYDHWNPPNTGATNSSGFTGLPGGYSSPDGFGGIGTQGGWWSATDFGPLAGPLAGSFAGLYDLHYNNLEFHPLTIYHFYGFSARCVRD
jgi:uncharacterized protein (TIGR02145 family)